MSERSSILSSRYLPWAVWAALLVWHSLRYNFVTDDAYISFVFSRNLAEHGSLVFNVDQPPVEGYTNFLWTFILGLLMLAKIPPEVSSLVLGTAFAAGTLMVALRLLEHIGKGASPWNAVAPGFLAMSSGFACWSSGGLETQLFTFLVASAIYTYVRADGEPSFQPKTAVLLALAAMTRPEGLLVAGVMVIHRLSLNIVRDRRFSLHQDELYAIFTFLGVWGPFFMWRWWYYGHPLPNTYYVKAAGEAPAGYHAELAKNGAYYVWQWATQSKALFAAPAVILAAIARPRTPRFVFSTLAISLLAVYLGYVVKVGGDFMGLHRFVMPLFFVVAVSTVLGLRFIVERAPPGTGRQAIAVAVVLLCLGAFAKSQFDLTVIQTKEGNWAADHGIDTPAYLKVYTEDRARIGKHMERCFEPDDFSIVGGAGAQPYFGRMRSIDVFGLVSDDIAHNVPPTRPRAGHNKWAPDSLLAKYEPAFVFSCYAIHADRDQYRLNCNPGFWRRLGYELATVRVPGLVQQGEFYTFLKRKDRNFFCPGLVLRDEPRRRRSLERQ